MTLQARFTDFYRTLNMDSLQVLDQVYHSEVTFKDPVTSHQGILALNGYFKNLLAGCEQCSFQTHDQQFTDLRGFVDWTMTFRSPRLNGGRSIDVDGSSVLRIRDDRIDYQRDYYDLGAMVYEQLPVLGSVIRHIRGRMAA